MSIKIGYYIGDGNATQAITGVGFQPDAIIISNNGNRYSVWRTSSMSTFARPLAKPAASNYNYVSFDEDGFTVRNLGSSDCYQNVLNIEYYYIAIKVDDANNVKVGYYTGTGGAGQTISGVGFQPDLVMVQGTGGVWKLCYWKTSANPANESMFFSSSVNRTDIITAITEDGFSVGSYSDINNNGTTYYYLCLTEISNKVKFGTYNGDGTNLREINVGFQPKDLWLKANSGITCLGKNDYTDDDPRTYYFSNTAEQDIIYDLTANGFITEEIASDKTNAISTEYYYACFYCYFGVVATPTADPDSGAVVSGTEVTLSCATSGATIYYTLDGSDPDDESDEYTDPIVITAETTIKAIAYKECYTESAIATFTYTLKVATPTADPDSGEYVMPQDITLSCATEGASIYYTLDATTPSDGSTLYTSAIEVTLTAIIKAKAYKTGYTASDVATFTYTPLFDSTVVSCLDELALRLEDTEEKRFPDETKLRALNVAQTQIARNLKHEYLQSLETIESNVDVSTGEYSLSSLTYTLILDEQGIYAVRVTIDETDYWAYELSIDQAKQLENAYFLPADGVFWYVFENKLYIKVGGDLSLTDATADIFYLKEPTTCTLFVASDLSSEYYHLWMSLAEASCWQVEGVLDRAEAVGKIAQLEIQGMNYRFKQEFKNELL